MPKTVSNWDRLKNRDADETLQYRDVYTDQQLERTKMQMKRTMASRLAANIALTVLVFILTYAAVGILLGMASILYGYGGGEHTFGYYVMHFTVWRFLISIAIAAIFFGVMYAILRRNLDVYNLLNETADINQYPNDQHVALPEEIQRKFDWFPDVGATSNVQFSSMISHCALSNKGLNMVPVARRVVKDVKDESGEVILYKGEPLRDEDDNILFEDKPMIDTEFAHALYEASGVPDRPDLRKFFIATEIPYNPDNKDRDKQKGYDTVADLINGDWQLPEYEPQRPGGAYLVDTAPVNTMVLAITRAGKGKCARLIA